MAKQVQPNQPVIRTNPSTSIWTQRRPCWKSCARCAKKTKLFIEHFDVCLKRFFHLVPHLRSNSSFFHHFCVIETHFFSFVKHFTSSHFFHLLAIYGLQPFNSGILSLNPADAISSLFKCRWKYFTEFELLFIYTLLFRANLFIWLWNCYKTWSTNLHICGTTHFSQKILNRLFSVSIIN